MTNTPSSIEEKIEEILDMLFIGEAKYKVEVGTSTVVNTVSTKSKEYLNDNTFIARDIEGKEAVKQLLTTLIQKEREEAVRGLKVRQISGFYKDILGRWFKRYPECGVLVTDELLLDALNVRQENIDAIEEYLSQTKGGEK